MAAVMLFLRQSTGKTERYTHFCMPLKPVFTRDCGDGVHFTDEPTGNLDSKTSMDVILLMQSISRQFRQTTIMITHNEEIAQMADRTIRIEDGKVISGGIRYAR